MKSSFTHGAAALAFAASIGWIPLANAQTTTVTTAPASPPPSQVVVQQPAPTPVATTTTTAAPVEREERVSGYAPNRFLLTSGLIVFGIPYTASLVAGATSNLDADHHLFVPLVGPWVDLANRPNCPPGSNACDNETTNKVLLGVDGVFQAIGTIEIISAFLSPEHKTVTTVPATAYTPQMTITPSRIASGYGVTALAQW
ncbi:MAG TPA: hypothetical protein VGI39_19700 [Polyangiaceae bacterium]|jgi:hypothetical protein